MSERIAGGLSAASSASTAGNIALGGLAFALPFLAYASNILHVFYIRGSSFLDAGWTAYLIHDADLHLHNPPFIGGSFFTNHISPLYLLTSAIGHLLPLTRIEFYAAFVGIAHALPALAVFWLLASGYGMTGLARGAAAAALGALFSFDGLALAIAKFPHFTMFLVGTAMMFLAALVLRRFRVALVFFLLCLITREDAGFHLFALLSLALILEWWRGSPVAALKPMAIFATAALLYSIATVGFQLIHPSEQSLLVPEYLGQPLFAGFSAAAMAANLAGWAAYRQYVVVPALGAVGWAILRRNPQIVLGYAAFVPWALMQLGAVKPLIAALASYYAFPFMLAGFWPLIGLYMQRRHDGTARGAVEPVVGFAVLTALSFVPSPLQHNPTHMRLPADFFAPPSFARQTATDQALIRLAGAKELGTEVVDQSVLALVPELYPPPNVLGSQQQAAPDSIIYFADGFESAQARAVAAAAGLDRSYRIAGTAIRVASRHILSGVAGLVELSPSR
ncbi:MAG: hypothetical protein ACM3JG_16880 [Thiohalocapsa sp.]